MGAGTKTPPPHFSERKTAVYHPYQARLIAEFQLLGDHFGDGEFDEQDFQGVLIYAFDLPVGYNQTHSQLLILLGGLYPEAPPDAFYLNRGLRRYGRVPGHYFEESIGDQKFLGQGLAYYCLHLTTWRPNGSSIILGDNLLTAVNAVYKSLQTE